MPDNKKDEINRNDIIFFLISKIFQFLTTLVHAALYICLAYLAYLSIDALAGKTTITNIVLKYLTSEKSDFSIPWILAFVFFVWAIVEKFLRKHKVKDLQGHIKELEKKVDPNRTTSGLLPTGETNPKDKQL